MGALALALTLRDTVLKNFLGSVTVFIDKPFKIGDYVKVVALKQRLKALVFAQRVYTRLIDP